MTDFERKRVSKVTSRLQELIDRERERELYADDEVKKAKAELDEKLYELIKESTIAMFDGRIPKEQAERNASRYGYLANGNWKEAFSHNSDPVKVASAISFMLVYQGMDVSKLS